MENPPAGRALTATIDEMLEDPNQLDRISAIMTEEIRASVPGYRGVPRESLHQDSRHTLITAVSNLAAGLPPNNAQLREISRVAEHRARQGISLAAVLAAYQTAGHLFWTILAEHARSNGVSDGDLLPAVTLIWEWLEVVSVAAADAHRLIERQVARDDRLCASESLRGVLLQPCSPATSERHIFDLGLDPDTPYVAFRGRLVRGVAATDIREELPDASAVGITHDGLFGLAASSPALKDCLPARLGTFGVGAAGSAGDLHASYVEATRALRAALRLGRSGTHTLKCMRLSAAAATDPDITRILSNRILAPLREQGDHAPEIWRSVVGYLEHGLQIDTAAAALHIHPNTLRNRLAKFTELTQLDLPNAADIAELWWLSTTQCTFVH